MKTLNLRRIVFLTLGIMVAILIAVSTGLFGMSSIG